MIDTSKKLIKEFLESNPRHKLIIQNEFEWLNPYDLGYDYSLQLLQVNNDQKFSFRSKEILDDICSSNLSVDHDFGKYLYLKNIGILFHKELRIDVNNFFKKHSLTYPLFIEWKGESNNDNLFFLTPEKGTRVHIGDISHLNLLRV